MPTLTCDIPEPLLRALEEQSARTGESANQIVLSALADVLEADEETLFQVSTSTALVEGVYDGTVTIGDLKQRGDFGLGTFDDLDGEMVALDGGFYQVRGRGEVSLAADTTEVPFAVVTDFRAERTFTLGRIASLEDLATQLDRQRATDNLFYAVRIGGHFSRIKARAISKTESGVPLIEAAAHQVEYELADVAGTLVGFWTPIYARTLNVPGWHVHFLSDDRTEGGHVFDVEASSLQVQMQDLADVRIAMPETPAFLEADLNEDPSEDLERAERDSSRQRS
jgi:acetolactate decarboxylase